MFSLAGKKHAPLAECKPGSPASPWSNSPDHHPHPQLWFLSPRPGWAALAVEIQEIILSLHLLSHNPWSCSAMDSLQFSVAEEDRANWTRPGPTLMCRTQSKEGAKGT